MSKLITPVQYEPALEELNEVRPLQLQVRPRRTLNIPILNKLPIESKKSVAGTLAKCTSSGALLNKNINIFDQVEQLTFLKGTAQETWLVEFTQRVYKVVTEVYYDIETVYFRWVTPTGGVMIQELNMKGISICNFVGTKMYVAVDFLIPAEKEFKFYGLY